MAVALDFKEADAISMQPIIVIVLLVIILCVLQFYINVKRKNAGLFLKSEIKSRIYILSRGALVHEIEIGERKYVVFESKNGVVELDGKNIEVDNE